jgi:glycosyltransferase involved in cell wall biosynthesis
LARFAGLHVRAGAGGAPPVNVLFLDQFSALGGAQRCLLDLLPAVEQRGWKARVAIPSGGPLVEVLRARPIEVDELPCGPYTCGTKSAADLLRFAVDLPRQTAAIAHSIKCADLVYVNGPRLLIAAALATRGRVPLVFHAHHRIEQNSARYVEGMALRQSGASVVACCEAVAQPLRDWVPNDRIHVIPNGTSDLGFVDRPFKRRTEWRIGIIGRIAPEKGQTQFLRAAARLVETTSHMRFVVCGGPLFGHHNYYNEVLQLAAGLPVEFLVWQEDVAGVMRDLDILVIPSKQEGMPRILLEALSAGVPVVAFPVGGIPEVIEDRSTGFLARGELAATIKEVLESDPQRVRSVVDRARREWERRYTVEKYRERITALMAQYVPCAARETTAPQRHRSATQR